MASLCLRVGDTVNLKFSQFKEGNTLEVLESKTGKKKEIIVPAKVWEIVERRRQAFRKTNTFSRRTATVHQENRL
jgi:hypothetical protein